MIAFYTFDSVTTDATGTYPLSGIPSPTYVSGWIGSAISFDAALAQRLSTSNLPLNGVSFSIDFWFYAANVSSGWDIPFMGQYTAQLTDQCLFLSIYFTKLYVGFFADDTFANTTLTPNTWYHAAFTFDSSTMLRSIYLNGILDGQITAYGLLQAASQPFTIGGARVGGRVPTVDSYYTGYIDHVRISTRVKSACEIYLVANLACYFTFNSASPPLDSSASGLSATNTGATLTTGAINQALQFTSANTYITVSGISALQTGNSPTFSISMWVRPTTIASGATIIHASTQANGQCSSTVPLVSSLRSYMSLCNPTCSVFLGQGSCVTMWGLTSTGRISVNVLDSSNNANAATASTPLQVNVWTHVAQTFSPSNGNRLYVNGMLVTTTSVPTGRPVGSYTIIGTALAGTSGCPAGSIATGQFYGGVDEYRVFRTELTATDICRLSNPL